jgi:hypothetical protein
MASAIVLPSAPNTGMTALGNVLLGAATDYANQARQDQVESRRRSERLQDIESARADSDRTYDRSRRDRLSDIEDAREYSDKEKADALKRELVRLGYLAAEDLKDEAALATAYAAFQQSAMAERYKGAIELGALRYEDLGNPEAVAAGLAQYSQILAEQGEFRRGLPAQAQERAGQLVAERDNIQRQAAELGRRLAEPAPKPDPVQVRNLAAQIARQGLKPGQTPSSADIQAAEGEARQQIATQLLIANEQNRRDAMIERQVLNDRLRDISSEINTITNRFGVVGVAPQASAAAPVTATPAAAPSLSAAQKAFADGLLRQVGGPAPTSAAAPAARQLFNPNDDPIIRAEQARRNEGAEALRLAPIADIQSQLADIDEQIRTVQQNPVAPPVRAMGPTSVPPAQFGQSFPAENLSSLYTRQAELRRRLQDIQPAPAAAPAAPSASWWMGPQ